MLIQALTSQIFDSLLCVSDRSRGACGAGIALCIENLHYLVTAHHVCSDPRALRARFSGRWNPIPGLERVYDDGELDLAIFRTSHIKLSRLTPSYGESGVYWGGVGMALGFPYSDGHLDEFPVAGERPLPIPTLVASCVSTNEKVGWIGGFVNSGYSGGALVLPATRDGKEDWSISGMIIARGATTKMTGTVIRVKRKIDADGNESELFEPINPADVDTADSTDTIEVLVREPTGMTKYIRMDYILKVIKATIASDPLIRDSGEPQPG